MSTVGLSAGSEFRHRLPPECGGEVKKDLSIRTHVCPHCNFLVDRDVASGQVIRNRGIKLISTAEHAGKETACAVGLSETRSNPSSRSEAKPHKGKTRKSS